MPGQPKANREDNTSLFVALAMAALSLLGVATVFGETIAAAFAGGTPVAPAAREGQELSTPALPPAANALPTTNGPDAGGSKS